MSLKLRLLSRRQPSVDWKGAWILESPMASNIKLARAEYLEVSIAVSQPKICGIGLGAR